MKPHPALAVPRPTFALRTHKRRVQARKRRAQAEIAEKFRGKPEHAALFFRKILRALMAEESRE